MNKLFEEDDSLPGQIDPDKDYYTELVGEGRKFKDEKALARSKAEADEFIKFKNKQFDQLSESYLKLKADYEARAKLEELIDQIPTRDNRELPNANNQPGIDPKDLETLIESKFTSYEKKQRQEENVKKAKELAREKLGQRWSSALK